MNKKQVSIIADVLLILAIPSGFWPYSYYIFLRWVIGETSIFNAVSFSKSKLTGRVPVFVTSAFLFNPLFPVYLNKNSWVEIDLISKDSNRFTH